MRTLTKLALLGVGGGAVAFVFGKSQRPANDGRADDLDRLTPDLAADPADPVQSLDDVSEFRDDQLGVDAQTTADQEAAMDLAAIDVEIAEVSEEDDRLDPVIIEEPMTLDAIEARQHDVGDLYGVHTPKAADREHPDDDVAFNEGENWMEALSASSTENGPEPEVDLDEIVDDEDIFAAPHASDTRDTPVADRGSGGPAGI